MTKRFGGKFTAGVYMGEKMRTGAEQLNEKAEGREIQKHLTRTT